MGYSKHSSRDKHTQSWTLGFQLHKGIACCDFRQERVDRTLNKNPETSAEGFCLWAELELRSQIFKNTFKKIYEH